MSLLNDILDHLDKRGLWLESGEIELNGSIWSYKFQKLKKKPRKQDNRDVNNSNRDKNNKMVDPRS